MDLADDIMNLLFPPHCPICDAYVEVRGGWCSDCLRKSLDVHRLSLEPAMSRLIEEAWSFGHYRSGLRNLLRDLKYKKKKQVLPYIRTLQRVGAPAFSWLLKENLLAVPVPLHYGKEKERGFNQAELLFRDWLEEYGVPMKTLLLRSRETKPQYGLGASERRENMKNAFDMCSEGDLEGRNVLLVDDILTTGATLSECAKVLKKNGSGKIYVLVMASDRG